MRRGHATKGCITRRWETEAERVGRSESAEMRSRRERSRKNCGRKLRRIGSLNYLGERKLGVCALIHRVFLLDISATTAAATVAAKAIARAKVRISHACIHIRVVSTWDETPQRPFAYELFSLIANKSIFSIFKDTLVPRICYLSTTSLVPAFPTCLTCLSVFALGRSGAACVHERFNLFFFIRPHSACRYTHYIRYCKLGFLTKRYRHLEIFTVNWNAQVPVRFDRSCNFTFLLAENVLRRIYIFFWYIILSYFFSYFYSSSLST